MVFSELIALYLFLGGTAAGSFAVISAIELCGVFSCLRDPHRVYRPLKGLGCSSRSATQRRIAKVVYSIAFVMIAIGMLCLLGDLGRPEAFYLLFLYPTSSFVSIGAFALTLLMGCLVVALAQSVLVLGAAWEMAALVAKAVGAVLALVVMVYTGLLLETVVAVRLWGSVWLPLLFLLSALSCGCAVVLLSSCLSEGYEGVRSWVRRLAMADAIFIMFEIAVTIVFAITVNAAHMSRPFDALLFGEQSLVFWIGFVGCGILLPLALELSALLTHRSYRASIVASMALLILVGGFCLRFVLVSAGVQAVV